MYKNKTDKENTKKQKKKNLNKIQTTKTLNMNNDEKLAININCSNITHPYCTNERSKCIKWSLIKIFLRQKKNHPPNILSKWQWAIFWTRVRLNDTKSNSRVCLKSWKSRCDLSNCLKGIFLKCRRQRRQGMDEDCRSRDESGQWFSVPFNLPSDRSLHISIISKSHNSPFLSFSHLIVPTNRQFIVRVHDILSHSLSSFHAAAIFYAHVVL